MHLKLCVCVWEGVIVVVGMITFGYDIALHEELLKRIYEFIDDAYARESSLYRKVMIVKRLTRRSTIGLI